MSHSILQKLGTLLSTKIMAYNKLIRELMVMLSSQRLILASGNRAEEENKLILAKITGLRTIENLDKLEERSSKPLP